jgi:short-subunit dehydrogenase
MRNPENETELKQLENVLVAKLDVLELDSIKKRLKMVFKNLEMLMYCNNAGYGAYGPLEAFREKKLYDSLTPMLLDFRCYQNRFTSF